MRLLFDVEDAEDAVVVVSDALPLLMAERMGEGRRVSRIKFVFPTSLGAAKQELVCFQPIPRSKYKARETRRGVGGQIHGREEAEGEMKEKRRREK